MSPETPSPCYQDEIKDCFKTMSGRIYATLRRLTQGDQQLSEDLVQETFQMACRNWQDLRELTEEERAGWLTRVAINTAIDVFRRNKTAKENLPQLWACYRPPEPDAHRDALTSAAIQRFIEVVDAMPAQRSLIAYLTWRCGWRGAEIARALGITPGRVSQHLKAARQELRDELGPYIPFETGEPEGGTRP